MKRGRREEGKSRGRGEGEKGVQAYDFVRVMGIIALVAIEDKVNRRELLLTCHLHRRYTSNT